MRLFTLALFGICLSAGCTGDRQDARSTNSRIMVPEPDIDQRLKYEALERLGQSGCVFGNPDTSVSGIGLRDPERTATLPGMDDETDSAGNYHLYSGGHNEILTLTQHPGDAKGQISIFKVERAGKEDYGYKALPVDTFRTEKNIRLGMSRTELVGTLGHCYAPLDSTKGYVELYYRLENPRDSRTGILRRHNMPVYYARYKFRDDALGSYEFGFEYP